MNPADFSWRQHILAILSRRRGKHIELRKAMDEMPGPALEELFRVLQDFEYDLNQAERTFRPFPGGPKIRL